MVLIVQGECRGKVAVQHIVAFEAHIVAFTCRAWGAHAFHRTMGGAAALVRHLFARYR